MDRSTSFTRIQILLAIACILQPISAERWVWVSSRPTTCLALANIRRGRRKAPPTKKGFNTIDTNPIADNLKPTTSKPDKRIYSMPGMYDLAFGY